MGADDTCISQAQLDELRAWAKGQLEVLTQSCKSLKELLGERDKFLNELIERNASEAATNHKQILGVIDLTKMELISRIENLIRENTAYREKNDIEIRTLREGRSTDKGMRAGSARFWEIIITILIALIITFLGNSLQLGRPTVERVETTAPAKK